MFIFNQKNNFLHKYWISRLHIIKRIQVSLICICKYKTVDIICYFLIDETMILYVKPVPTRGTFGNIFFNLTIVKDRNFHQFTYTETYVSCVHIFRQIIGLVIDWTFQQWCKLHKYQQTTQINGHNNINGFMRTFSILLNYIYENNFLCTQSNFLSKFIMSTNKIIKLNFVVIGLRSPNYYKAKG